MEKIIVYTDDAAYAVQLLAPMAQAPGEAPASPTHWIVVACPPRMTRRISKWVSASARENWRRKWADKLFEQVVPALHARGDSTATVLANGPLIKLSEQLQLLHGAARVMDARRPKFGQEMQPVTAGQPAPGQDKWAVPGAVAGLGAVLVLAAE